MIRRINHMQKTQYKNGMLQSVDYTMNATMRTERANARGSGEIGENQNSNSIELTASLPPDLKKYSIANNANNVAKRNDSITAMPGANLVVNRKSLNVESTKNRHDRIRADNQKMLEKL